MNKNLIFVVELLCAGCVFRPTSPLSLLPISVVSEINNKPTRLTVSLEDDELTCSCSNCGIEITGLKVYFYEETSCDSQDFASGEIFSKYPDAKAVLENDDSGEMWVAQRWFSTNPFAVFECYEGGEGGGFIKSRIVFVPKVRIPIDDDGYGCLGVDVELKEGDKISVCSVYLFRDVSVDRISRKFRRVL